MKRKTTKVNFVIPLVAFPYDVMVSFGESKIDLKKSVEKYLPDAVNEIDEIPLKNAHTLLLSTNQLIIWLRVIPESSEDFSVLQHEIFHAVEMLLKRIGVKLSDDSAEVYAYLIQYLTKGIYEKITSF
jgi:hypothetical protein